MALFRYKAMDAGGAFISGRIDAVNLADLEAQLLHLGLDLIDARRLRLQFGNGIPRRALINFCFHLEHLVGAGVPIVDALKDLRDSILHPNFRAVLGTMAESVEGGKRLSEAMADHPRIFDPVVVSLIQAGEDSGKLPEILASLVASLKWQDELASHARRLAIYPAALGLVTLGLLVFMMTYLVPKLTIFLKGMGRELPWHTELLIGISRVILDDWYFLLGVPAICGVILAAALHRSPRFRFAWDSIKLRVPLLGNILRRIILGRFANVLALLYGAGISVLDAIQATERVVGNAAIARGLRRANRLISAGETIASAFGRVGLFPPLVIRMLRVGENTGELDRALSNVAYFFNRDVKEAVERLQAMIEPIIIVLIGATIGWIMLSVLGPIYDLIATIGV
jgi:type IV pilus assembly protein PilC